ncbi:hypothetical protein M422DRAFT_23148 [Sphaerobolus stellatus SS14]|nr:hypothetical protein M422DRAFT_23148 [Sphaerobolus stellatus SS14]
MLNVLRPSLRALARPRIARPFHSTSLRRDFTNILADGSAPAVQVQTITAEGQIELVNGMRLPGACIFLGGKVFLWDVPPTLWKGWDTNRFQIFDVVVPKPEILVLGTGQRTAQIPPNLRAYLRQIGIQVEAMDTRSACSTYNLLAEEGRTVAAALLPLSPASWEKESS